MPISVRLNLFLVGLVVSSALCLLWAASHVQAAWQVWSVGALFSYVMLCDYALLHEATHDNLHPVPRWNRWLGRLCGALFPAPFSMVRATHTGHHSRNRTDAEMFDLYYARDSRFLKCVQWYGILTGFFWPLVPLGALLASFAPRILRTKVFRRRDDMRHLLADLDGRLLVSIRLETLGILILFPLLFVLLDLKVSSVLVCYVCFAVNWSTRQYVGHAFTKRDVIHGAWNLKHNRLMSFVLLHGEWDLNHHRAPETPWIHLPKLPTSESERRSYLAQYWRQWLGPKLAAEPSPRVLEEPVTAASMAPSTA